MRLLNRTTPCLALSGFVWMTAAAWFLLTRAPFPSETAREPIGSRIEIDRHPPGETQVGVFHDNGTGPCIVLFPSAGRETSDFNSLITALKSSGYRAISVEAGGINGSSLSLAETDGDATFSVHMANALICNSKPTVLIGHAYGNRIVRSHAALSKPQDAFDASYLDRPTQKANVKAVILLAAGGQVPMEPKAEQSLRDIFNPLKSHKSRMKDVRYAFFAEGNDIPDHWTRGWHTKTAIAQGKAVAASVGDDSWHCAGGVPMLIVQPMQDRISPIENAYALRDKCPQEIEIVEVQNAGHALLPEQPEAVADAVLAFLAKHHPIPTAD